MLVAHLSPGSVWLCPCRQRLPVQNVYYVRSAEHRNHYVLSFAFAFDREEDVYQFSVCFPYSYSRLQLYLSEVERLKLSWIRRETLAQTVVSAVSRGWERSEDRRLGMPDSVWDVLGARENTNLLSSN